MEKEEIKRIIKEALRELFEEYHREWEYLWREWVKEGYPPPPWYFIPVSRREIRDLREYLSEFYKATNRLFFLVSKFETWAPECSEKEKIETIQKEVRDIDGKIDKILKILQEWGKGDR